jgi:hypothetical protein
MARRAVDRAGPDRPPHQRTLERQGAARLRRWSGSAAITPLVNIVATLPGDDPAAPAVVLVAYCDSVWGSPGAADNGAGIASALEIVRAVKADPRRRTLMVVFTDGEELELEGGHALAASDPDPAPDRKRIIVIVNLETRGDGGRAAIFNTGHDNGAMMRLFGETVAHPSATSLSVLVYELLPNSTDFIPAKSLGLPGFSFAFIGRPAYYHSPLATAANLDRGALQDMGGQALDLVRALLTAPKLSGKAPNFVFFDAFGLSLVRYSAAADWLVVEAAIILFAAAARRARAGVGDLLRGLAAVIATVVVAAGLPTEVNLLSGAGKGANYFDRFAAIPRLEVQALMIATATIGFVLAVFQPRQRQAQALATGIALPLLVLGVVAQAAASTAADIVGRPLSSPDWRWPDAHLRHASGHQSR